MEFPLKLKKDEAQDRGGGTISASILHALTKSGVSTYIILINYLTVIYLFIFNSYKHLVFFFGGMKI